MSPTEETSFSSWFTPVTFITMDELLSLRMQYHINQNLLYEIVLRTSQLFLNLIDSTNTHTQNVRLLAEV